ncbi:MAG TPA: DUF4270 family protein [Chitinophagaceae bacterium]
MNLRPAFLFTLLIFIFASCTKIESTEIGTGLIPPVDNINTFDTSLGTVTRNAYDTGYVYPLRNDNMVLGRISNDPLFGKTTGIINVQLQPEYMPFRFRGIYDSLKLDSMVLVLSYRGVWGDTNVLQKLNVYEIDPASKFSPDSVYATRMHISYLPTVLGSATVDVRKLIKNDTLEPYGEVVRNNQIRIKITDPNIQQRLFQDTTTLQSDTGFKLKFKGFAIVPDTAFGGNALMVVNLADNNTKVAFYYRGRLAGATQSDTAATYFRLTSRSAYANQVIRNPVGAEYLATLDAAPDSLVYLQTRPDAPYTKIRIPGLDSLPNAIIHRAELIVEQVPNPATPGMDDYFSPPALFLSAYSTDSSRKFILPGGDVQFDNTGVTNLASFGAYPYRRNVNGQNITFYAFNMTRYVQGIVTNKNRSFDMVLSAPFADYIFAVENLNSIIPVSGSGVLNPLALGRIRAGGGTHSSHRMRLRIVYTRI